MDERDLCLYLPLVDAELSGGVAGTLFTGETVRAFFTACPSGDRTVTVDLLLAEGRLYSVVKFGRKSLVFCRRYWLLLFPGSSPKVFCGR